MMETMLTMKNDFDVREEKDIKGSKIYIRNLDIRDDSFETKLLEEESIEDVIRFQFAYEEKERILVFDVGETISFDEYLKTNKLNREDICNILISIDSIVRSMENYLISENSISLDLRLIRIYKERRKIKLKFIIIPNYDSDFSYQLSKLLIKVLRYIDTSDRDALNLAYGLFVRSSKEGYMLRDLMELVDTVQSDGDYGQSDYDSEEHRMYDEKLADEIEDDLANNFYNYDYYNDIEDSRQEDTNYISKSYIENNKIIDNRTYDEKRKSSMEEPIIDDETRDFLEDEIYEDFNKEDKKIIKFNRNQKKSRKKRKLNAHINISYICSVFVPIILVAVPIIYFVLNGKTIFIKNISFVLAYELVTIVLLAISRIISYRTKNI